MQISCCQLTKNYDRQLTLVSMRTKAISPHSITASSLRSAWNSAVNVYLVFIKMIRERWPPDAWWKMKCMACENDMSRACSIKTAVGEIRLKFCKHAYSSTDRRWNLTSPSPDGCFVLHLPAQFDKNCICCGFPLPNALEQLAPLQGQLQTFIWRSAAGHREGCALCNN